MGVIISDLRKSKNKVYFREKGNIGEEINIIEVKIKFKTAKLTIKWLRISPLMIALRKNQRGRLDQPPLKPRMMVRETFVTNFN